MDTNLLFDYYEEVGHERFLKEVLNKQLPPEIQECFDKMTECVKMFQKLECFPLLFIIKD